MRPKVPLQRKQPLEAQRLFPVHAPGAHSCGRVLRRRLPGLGRNATGSEALVGSKTANNEFFVWCALQTREAPGQYTVASRSVVVFAMRALSDMQTCKVGGTVHVALDGALHHDFVGRFGLTTR